MPFRRVLTPCGEAFRLLVSERMRCIFRPNVGLEIRVVLRGEQELLGNVVILISMTSLHHVKIPMVFPDFCSACRIFRKHCRNF